MHVDLKLGVSPRDPSSFGNIQSSTPGVVWGDLIILGSATNQEYASAPGDIRAFDVRTALPYPPYDIFAPKVPVLSEGDVDARVWVRVREAQESLTLIERMLDSIPRGPLCEDVRAREGEGLGLVEGFRGDVLIWLRLDAEGTIARCHVRDPSWLQWPLLEAAIEGNIVGDFPLCNKSFNCSYSGHDL